jgi:hypothetical protein
MTHAKTPGAPKASRRKFLGGAAVAAASVAAPNVVEAQGPISMR